MSRHQDALVLTSAPHIDHLSKHTPSLLAWQARSNVESSEEAVAEANPGGKDLTTSSSYLVRILPLLAAVRVWVKRLGHVCSA